jgi:hypothetical protein
MQRKADSGRHDDARQSGCFPAPTQQTRASPNPGPSGRVLRTTARSTELIRARHWGQTTPSVANPIARRGVVERRKRSRGAREPTVESQPVGPKPLVCKGGKE